MWSSPSGSSRLPNAQATLGLWAPALARRVPIEEYIFYFTAFITVLLPYVWLSEYWVAAYSVEDYAGESRALCCSFTLHR